MLIVAWKARGTRLQQGQAKATARHTIAGFTKQPDELRIPYS